MIKIIKESFLALSCFVIFTKALHVLIYWDKYIGGPFIFDPDGGWIRDLIIQIIGMRLDDFFGITIFTPAFSWITGALFYVPIYGIAFWGLKLLFGIKYMEFYVGFPIYLLITAFFFAVYYFHILDDIEFFNYLYSMAETTSSYIKSYVWVGMGFGVWLTFVGWYD